MWLWIGALAYVALAAPSKRRLLAAAIPILVLLGFLTSAVLSQNVAYQLQAPATLLLYFLTICGIASGLSRVQRMQWLATISALICFIALVVVPNLRALSSEIRYLTNSDYINYMPVHLAPKVPDTATIALTEAGRLAYWMPGRKVDLVGLNTPYTARNGADPRFLDKIAPDLIFIHLAGTVSLDCGSEPFCLLSADDLTSAVRSANLPVSSTVKNRVDRAPLAVFEFLAGHQGQFALVLARYGESYEHLYAIDSNGAITLEAFLEALRKSFTPAGRFSYTEGLQKL